MSERYIEISAMEFYFFSERYPVVGNSEGGHTVQVCADEYTRVFAAECDGAYFLIVENVGV